MYLCPIKFEVGESKHKYSSPLLWVLIFHMHAFKALDLSDHRVIKCLLCTHRLNSCQKKLPNNFGYSWYFF